MWYIIFLDATRTVSVPLQRAPLSLLRSILYPFGCTVLRGPSSRRRAGVLACRVLADLGGLTYCFSRWLSPPAALGTRAPVLAAFRDLRPAHNIPHTSSRDLNFKHQRKLTRKCRTKLYNLNYHASVSK